MNNPELMNWAAHLEDHLGVGLELKNPLIGAKQLRFTVGGRLLFMLDDFDQAEPEQTVMNFSVGEALKSLLNQGQRPDQALANLLKNYRFPFLYARLATESQDQTYILQLGSVTSSDRESVALAAGFPQALWLVFDNQGLPVYWQFVTEPFPPLFFDDVYSATTAK